MTLLHPDALRSLAAKKWAEIGALSPDLAPAVALQQRLVRIVLDAASSLDDTVALSLSPEAISDKLGRGIPVLRNENVDIPARLTAFLEPICTTLAEGGAGDSALHIRDAIVRKDIDAVSLLSVSLARNHNAIRTSALHMGFSPDLVWLIGELASSPLAHHLQRKWGRVHFFSESGQKMHPTPFSDWDRGYCPFCGSWPVLIEAVGGSRTLRCSYCALAWTLSSDRCIYCGNAGEDFVAAAPDVRRPQQRVELCGTCSGYTKVIDVSAPTPFPLLAIDDLATMGLDSGAMDRGYRRPELFDLDAIAPRTPAC